MTKIKPIKVSELFQLELQAAVVMEQLLSEGLILEARMLVMKISLVLHKSYSEDQVKAHLLTKFPDEQKLERLFS